MAEEEAKDEGSSPTFNTGEWGVQVLLQPVTQESGGVKFSSYL